MGKPKQYSIGVDYGTNSVRAIVAEVGTGKIVGTHVYNYGTGKQGVILDPSNPLVARQNPADYITGFYTSVRGALRQAKKVKGFDSDNVMGVGIDTTGSTPMPVNEEGIPLAMLSQFKGNLAAQAYIWKAHDGWEEATLITKKAIRMGVEYLAKCGMTYSSEWFWSKIWHCQRTAPDVFRAAYSWVEACDFIPAYITSHNGEFNPRQIARSVCAAGHKAMYNDVWGGLPSKEFLKELSPDLAALRDRLYDKAVPSDKPAGYLDEQVARRLGLNKIPVAVGAFDAHHGAVGAGIQEGRLVKIIGTSTCDMMVAREISQDIPGICGIVNGSIIPGMYGLEAGQSAVGDIFNWFVTYLGASGHLKKGEDPHQKFSKAASQLKPGESGLMALDWNNGNRTILVDPLLSGLQMGHTLHTTGPETYRALVEATAFGALTIINRFKEYGVNVNEVVNCGGIAEKNPFLMQLYADVLDRPMKFSRSKQTCALGAAVFGAVAGGAYKTTEEAQAKMTGLSNKEYRPIRANAKTYEDLYKLYFQLHEAFKKEGPLGNVMKGLASIRGRVRKA